MLQKNKFEKDYFEGYFRGISDFSPKKERGLRNWFRSVFHFLNRWISLAEGKGRRVIEFGCGTGAAAQVLHELGFQVVATDISRYALSRAQKNYPQIKFLRHDIHNPFRAKEKFDLAFVFDVIEHLEKPEKAIRNVYWVLKKDGVAVFSTPNKLSRDLDPTHISLKGAQEWQQILKKAGFRKIVIKRATFIPLLHKYHWRLNIALPLAVNSAYIVSPVYLIAWP